VVGLRPLRELGVSKPKANFWGEALRGFSALFLEEPLFFVSPLHLVARWCSVFIGAAFFYRVFNPVFWVISQVVPPGCNIFFWGPRILNCVGKLPGWSQTFWGDSPMFFVVFLGRDLQNPLLEGRY